MTLEFIMEEKLAKSVYKALLPETIAPATERSKSKVMIEGKKLIIEISSKDFTSIRASINSYMRWIKAIIKSIKMVKKYGYN